MNSQIHNHEIMVQPNALHLSAVYSVGQIDKID